jgi:O-methyltransferase involved in polyketide biosynthesis
MGALNWNDHAQEAREVKMDARSLDGVPQTLLFTLYMRYRESQRPDGKVSGPRYTEIMDRLEFDRSLFDEVPDDMQLSLACRSVIFDTLTRNFLARHPSGVAVSLGPGMDFRHERLDNGAALWVDIDLPGVMALRRVLFPETPRHRLIAGSVLDSSWFREVPPGKPALFIAEGLLVYLQPQEERSILSGMGRIFHGSELILDVYSHWYLHAARNGTPYPFLNRMYGMWRWGMDHWQEIEAFDSNIHFVEEYFVYDGFGERMPRGLRDALSDDGVYTDKEQEIIRTMSRIGRFRFDTT